MQSAKPDVALLASPGMGHLIPILELGKRLVTDHGLVVTIFVVTTDATSLSKSPLLKQSSIQNLLDIIFLPPVDISGAIANLTTSIFTQLAIMMRQALPTVRSAISAMKIRPGALIVDLFGTEILGIADEFDMLKFVFVTSTAWYLALNVQIPVLDKQALDRHVEKQEPLSILGCKPVRFSDTYEPILNRQDQMFTEFVRIGIEISKAHGVLVNSWHDLEPRTLDALGDENKLGRVVKAPIYPIGPLVRPAKPALRSEVLDWLDKQPSESVIYVSFGSGGTLSAKQTTELAWGLQLSQQRFIWVLRPPIENDASATVFNMGNEFDGSPNYLPDGFLTRTHNAGIVAPMWAPQAEILAHPSVGGFLSHCGWNSTLESIVNGVPMIGWPLYAEQKMNATLLTEDVGIAVRSKALPSSGIVRREEIESMVRKIMVEKQGHATRSKVKELKYSAQKALSVGGSSYNSLSNVAKECKDRLRWSKA